MVSTELPRAIGALHEGALVGPWPDALRKRKCAAPFVPSIDAETHAHERVELCQLLAGRCSLSFRHEHYHLRTGDLGLFGPNEPHTETYCAKHTPYRLAWWLPAADQVYFQVTDYTPQHGFRFLDRVTLRPLGQDGKAASRHLRGFCAAQEPPSILAVKEAMLTLAVSVLRRLLTQLHRGPSNAHGALIEQAKTFIAENTGRTVTIAEVASAVLLSPNYLTTVFKKEVGVSLGAWIKRQRIARAKDLLATTQMSVKRIAYALGFDDPYAFSHAFKRAEGVSPAHYRESAR